MKKKEEILDNQGHTCPNPLCGKTFINPIRARNMCSKGAEVYEACPFCLTEIVVDKPSSMTEDNKDSDIKEDKEEQLVTYPQEKPLNEPSSKANACPHHLGYLSQRASKTNIPEECIVCENIVQCMLKKITG
jgi:hypothetical protein